MNFKKGLHYRKLFYFVLTTFLCCNVLIKCVNSINENNSPYIYCTYFGGSNNDIIEHIVIDEERNIIVVGGTFSEDLELRNAYQEIYGGGIQPSIHENGGDGFIAKFAVNGSMIFGTYFGGSLLDEIIDVIVDSDGNIVVTGNTQSLDFPITEDALQKNFSGGVSDIFLAKFMQNGTLVHSTFFGGTGDDVVSGIGIDSYGDIYITGGTSSNDFNTTLNGTQQSFGGNIDSFITKFDSSLTEILYSSYIGGDGIEISYNINIDFQNNIIVTGITMSDNFPLKNAIKNETEGTERDIFIHKVNSTGSIAFSTYWGGSHFEDPFGAAIDILGNIIVSGRTASNDYPTHNAFQSQFGGEVDGMILKLTGNGQEVIFSSYYGGPAWETIHHVSINSNSSIYAAGIGSQNNLMVRSFQSQSAGGSDLVLIKVDQYGELEFSSYYGGTANETPFDILYFNGTIFVVGSTRSESSFTSEDAYQINSNGETEGFILVFDVENYLSVTPFPSPSNMPLILGISLPLVVVVIPIILYIFRKNKK